MAQPTNTVPANKRKMDPPGRMSRPSVSSAREQSRRSSIRKRLDRRDTRPDSSPKVRTGMVVSKPAWTVDNPRLWVISDKTGPTEVIGARKLTAIRINPTTVRPVCSVVFFNMCILPGIVKKMNAGRTPLFFPITSLQDWEGYFSYFSGKCGSFMRTIGIFTAGILAGGLIIAAIAFNNGPVFSESGPSRSAEVFGTASGPEDRVADGASAAAAASASARPTDWEYRWLPPKLPEEIDFAGEKTPLDRWEVRERLDRELLVNSYLHGSTLYILKLANRIFPV